MRSCTHCGDPIPSARLEAIPNTDTCVKCSDEKPRMADPWTGQQPENKKPNYAGYKRGATPAPGTDG
jgi:RNA polymerase-binding transcription factor DksA